MSRSLCCPDLFRSYRVYEEGDEERWLRGVAIVGLRNSSRSFAEGALLTVDIQDAENFLIHEDEEQVIVEF